MRLVALIENERRTVGYSALGTGRTEAARSRRLAATVERHRIDFGGARSPMLLVPFLAAQSQHFVTQ
jgi:hypothetical protein